MWHDGSTGLNVNLVSLLKFPVSMLSFAKWRPDVGSEAEALSKDLFLNCFSFKTIPILEVLQPVSSLNQLARIFLALPFRPNHRRTISCLRRTEAEDAGWGHSGRWREQTHSFDHRLPPSCSPLNRPSPTHSPEPPLCSLDTGTFKVVGLFLLHLSAGLWRWISAPMRSPSDTRSKWEGSFVSESCEIWGVSSRLWRENFIKTKSDKNKHSTELVRCCLHQSWYCIESYNTRWTYFEKHLWNLAIALA